MSIVSILLVFYSFRSKDRTTQIKTRHVFKLLTICSFEVNNANFSFIFQRKPNIISTLQKVKGKPQLFFF